MSDFDSNELTSPHLRRRFDRAAANFASADFVHRAAAEGLLQRMLPMTVEPRCIVDLGSALGAGGTSLAKQYRKAHVIGVDLSAGMLRKARANRRWFSKTHEVQADASKLPLRAGSADLVFANMLLPWIGDTQSCFAEVARVLRKDGLFAFSTLGPASFTALRDAWAAIDDEPHVHRFADMHNIGDAIVHAGLRDPVLDVDALTVTYKDADTLFADLTAAGARNSLSARRKTLTGKSRIRKLRENLNSARTDGSLQIDLELVFGHAWGGEPPQVPGEYRFSPTDIGRMKR